MLTLYTEVPHKAMMGWISSTNNFLDDMIQVHIKLTDGGQEQRNMYWLIHCTYLFKALKE